MKNKIATNNDIYKTMGYAALLLGLSLPLSILVMQIFNFVLGSQGIYPPNNEKNNYAFEVVLNFV